jgi:RNA polymerase sigma-70 factor (ECF subfamily)
LEEQQAIARLKRGDLSGLEPLVELYQVKAVYAAYLIVHDMSQAEDIVQTAFLHAYEKIHQYDAHRPFSAWFLQSVVHAALKVAKRQARTVSLQDECDDSRADYINHLLEPSPGPEEQSILDEIRVAVWQALKVLPPEQRAAIVMHHFLDMDAREIINSLPENHLHSQSIVYWWLREARKRLRTLLLPFWLSRQDQEERQDRP